MHPYRSIITRHRLQRLVLWALALLSWIAAVLQAAGHGNARYGRIAFSPLTHGVRTLLIVRAYDMVGHRSRGRTTYWRRGRDLRRRHFIRSLLGAKLRRALTHRDPATLVAQLIELLRNLDAYAARLARNIRRRHRLWRIAPPIAPAQTWRCPLAPSPAIADSS